MCISTPRTPTVRIIRTGIIGAEQLHVVQRRSKKTRRASAIPHKRISESCDYLHAHIACKKNVLNTFHTSHTPRVQKIYTIIFAKIKIMHRILHSNSSARSLINKRENNCARLFARKVSKINTARIPSRIRPRDNEPPRSL